MPDFFSDLRQAIQASGLQNGMRISFHHHLRHGDEVVSTILPILTEMGFKNLTLCVSSLIGDSGFAVLEAGKKGTIRDLETTGLKEPLAGEILSGKWPGNVIFRSHGGRAGAITTGRTPIHLAFIAASAVDQNGNINGIDGHSRFGSLGYGITDAAHAQYVLAVTDHTAQDRLSRNSISSHQVNGVVQVKSIGNRKLISTGTLRQSRKPLDVYIAQKVIQVLEASGVVQEGFAYQAGSGAISVMTSQFLVSMMKERKIHGSFASGGITSPLVHGIECGVFQELYDVQSFDDIAACSLKNNSNHREMGASEYASPFEQNRISSRLDAMILSGTEIDVEFNLNSLTGTNGRILGALGGGPDTAEDSQLTIVAMPSMRGRIPSINSTVRTICTLGQYVDVLVTERGICVHPQREDIAQKLRDSRITTLSIRDFKEKIHRITGIPETIPRKSSVAIVEERRGAILDKVHQY
ncbi:MAG: citrate lyase subunit alpha [Spirochaetales bacterium]|nr:citrate lyase subunit alpha [Spirochaetales bacterium]